MKVEGTTKYIFDEYDIEVLILKHLQAKTDKYLIFEEIRFSRDNDMIIAEVPQDTTETIER